MEKDTICNDDAGDLLVIYIPIDIQFLKIIDKYKNVVYV